MAAFGYALWTRIYETLPTEPVRVLFVPAPIALEGLEVSVAGRAGDPISRSRDAFVIDSVLLRTLPTILETDVLRATAVSPSASAPSDYTSVPFIRGGTSEGTPVLLDGVRLFNAFHLGGFLSAINAEVVERASVLAGSGGDGMAMGSLSGAIDIATRDGARDEMRMAGSLGLASSRLSVEGPVFRSAATAIPRPCRCTTARRPTRWGCHGGTPRFRFTTVTGSGTTGSLTPPWGTAASRATSSRWGAAGMSTM